MAWRSQMLKRIGILPCRTARSLLRLIRSMRTKDEAAHETNQDSLQAGCHGI